MNSSNLNRNYVQEIDLIDLFWEWLAHWRSLLVFIAAGVVLAGLWLVPSILGSSGADALPGIEEPEEVEISESDAQTVNELIEHYESYNALKDEYYSNSGSYSITERAEVFDRLTSVWSRIESIRKGMTDEQKEVFYKLQGVDTETEKDIEAKAKAKAEAEAEAEAAVSTSALLKSAIKKGVLCVFVAVFLHVAVVCMFYVFNTKLKHSDKLMRILNCAELSKCVDWDAINSKKGLDKLVAKARLSHVRKVDLAESIQINADSINNIAVNADITSIAIVSGGLIAEAEELKKALLSVNEKLEIRCISSLIYDAAGAKTVSDVRGAVILADVRKSDIRELREESFALANREINLIGAIAYIL